MSNQMLPNAKLAMLAHRLGETLTEEVVALSGVRDALAGMLDAIRSSDPDRLNASAMALHDFVHVATEHRNGHRRQVDLFFRIAGTAGDSIAGILLLLHPLPEARAACDIIAAARKDIQDIGSESGRLVAAADYALRQAGQVNHELILVLHGLMQPAGSTVYTSRGKTSTPPGRRSMLDQRG
jgi:hypothetical protein